MNKERKLESVVYKRIAFFLSSDKVSPSVPDGLLWHLDFVG